MSTPLGDFIRARRDATTPETVGLTAGPRRRVPGLRRSELAERAGISVEYLVRIEQGADHNPSPSVLNALASALALDASDRGRLWHLAKIGDGCSGPGEDPALPTPEETVRPTVLALLDQLEPAAALVTNRLGDLLAHTRTFDLLARPTGLLDGDRPNLTSFVFTDARARDAFPDWDRLADEQAADIWLGPSGDEFLSFLAWLEPLAGAAFTERVNGHPLPERADLRWRHPEVGELRLTREVLELPVADAQQLVVFLPADPATEAALESLRAAASTPLRVVG